MSDQSLQSGIYLTTKFFFLAFFCLFCPVRVILDGGEPKEVGWGNRFIPLPPGQHTIRCYMSYLWPTVGDATTTINVTPGQVVNLSWKAPWLVFLPGTFKVGKYWPYPVAAETDSPTLKGGSLGDGST